MSIPVLESGLVSQRVISEEIEKIHASARAGETQPRLDFAPYRSAVLRHPARDLRYADPEGAELVAPVFGRSDVDPLESDLTIQGASEPIGSRIVVRGRVLDGDGRPVRRQLVEISSPARTRGTTTTTPGGPRISTSRCSAPTSPSG